MIILLSILFILCIVIAVILYNNNNSELCFLLGIISFILGMALLILVMVVIILKVDCLNVNEKIMMYETENKKIESDIKTIVENYQDYESKIFGDIKNISVNSLVTMFPELKSDTLVNKQIETYIANNNEIKDLKEMEIDGKKIKWLIYFGG